jgi:UDP-glucose:(heptosyl)LPS alpha-1,3-glucosyltransferase
MDAAITVLRSTNPRRLGKVAARTMKIGIIYHKLMQAGGQERYLFNVVSEFLRQGHEVHVIAARRGDDTLPIHFHPVPIVNNPHSLRMLTFAFRSGRIAQQLGLDITYGLGKTFAQNVHRSGGGMHRVYLQQSGQMHRRFWSPKDWAALYLDKRLYHGGETKWFVANSQLIKDQIVTNYGVDAQKITVIYTGVDGTKFNPVVAAASRDTMRSKLRLSPGERVFLFASFDHPRKGLATLLPAFPREKAKLVVVGRALNASYRALIADLRLDGNLVDAGPQENMAAWYGLADFMVLPSLYDPLPNVVLESLACGTPVVVSAQTGAAERIEEGKDGFVLKQAGDVASLRDKLERIMSLSDTELKAMRDAAAAKGKLFNLAEHVQELVALFERVRRMQPQA